MENERRNIKGKRYFRDYTDKEGITIRQEMAKLRENITTNIKSSIKTGKGGMKSLRSDLDSWKVCKYNLRKYKKYHSEKSGVSFKPQTLPLLCSM